jgi:hypothetical protein
MKPGNRTRDTKRIWRQSPDGRPVAARGDGNDRRVDSPPRERTDDPQIIELQAFLEACLSVIPERLEQGPNRLGVLLFLLGAADRFWELYGLDDRGFQPYAESLLRRFGLSADEAATLVAALPQLPGQASARRAMVLGGDALETWVRSHDPNVALQLTELVAAWRGS